MFADWIIDNRLFGAQSVIISSASAKTAYGTAFELDRKDVRVIGLTSPGNKDFTAGLGCYDEVFTYDELDNLPADTPVMLADFTGKQSLPGTLRDHLGDALVKVAIGGMTNQQSASVGTIDDAGTGNRRPPGHLLRTPADAQTLPRLGPRRHHRQIRRILERLPPRRRHLGHGHGRRRPRRAGKRLARRLFRPHRPGGRPYHQLLNETMRTCGSQSGDRARTSDVDRPEQDRGGVRLAAVAAFAERRVGPGRAPLDDQYTTRVLPGKPLWGSRLVQWAARRGGFGPRPRCRLAGIRLLLLARCVSDRLRRCAARRSVVTLLAGISAPCR